LFTRDYAEETDDGALIQYAGLVVLLSLLVLMSGNPLRSL
jgi:hypothetical protein